MFAGAAGAIAGDLINDRLAWAVAFGLGLLPTPAVQRFIVDRTRKALNLPDISSAATDPNLAFLQGWDADVSDKFARAGVTSVQQLACSNQFQLFLRSNFEWRVILDFCDQALLVLYVGESINNLRPLGIGSAVELAGIDWFSEDDDEYFVGFTYDEAIGMIASAVGKNEKNAGLLVRSLSEDATVKFLGVPGSDDTPEEGEDDEEEGEGTEKEDEEEEGTDKEGEDGDKEMEKDKDQQRPSQAGQGASDKGAASPASEPLQDPLDGVARS